MDFFFFIFFSNANAEKCKQRVCRGEILHKDSGAYSIGRLSRCTGIPDARQAMNKSKKHRRRAVRPVGVVAVSRKLSATRTGGPGVGWARGMADLAFVRRRVLTTLNHLYLWTRRPAQLPFAETLFNGRRSVLQSSRRHSGTPAARGRWRARARMDGGDG